MSSIILKGFPGVIMLIFMNSEPKSMPSTAH